MGTYPLSQQQVRPKSRHTPQRYRSFAALTTIGIVLHWGRASAKTHQHDAERDQGNEQRQKKPNYALHDSTSTSLSVMADCNVLRPTAYSRLVAVEEYDSAG